MKLLGNEISVEDFDNFLCEQSNGKELVIENGKIVAKEHFETENDKKKMEKTNCKILLEKYKEDVEQVALFDMKSEDVEEKKKMCRELIQKLREL